METDRKRTQRDYPWAFKLAVVEAVEKGELTYKQAQRKYGIQGRSTVLVWTVYLSLVTAAYSRKIVGYHVHDSLQTEQVSQALRMALRSRRSRQALVHHSDRGIQYCSTYYQAIHQRHGLTCSMTDGYDCYQNAMAERINGIVRATCSRLPTWTTSGPEIQNAR